MKIDEDPIVRVRETDINNLLVLVLVHLNALVKYLLELGFTKVERNQIRDQFTQGFGKSLEILLEQEYTTPEMAHFGNDLL